jgi:ABC-type transporter Mla subunit MlaD
MQASNDILTQIVLTDNNIFSELKILLDYKDFEKKEVEHRAETVEGRIDRFQTTITRLQQENDKLKAGAQKQITKENRMLIYLFSCILALVVVIIYAVRLKKLRKTYI